MDIFTGRFAYRVKKYTDLKPKMVLIPIYKKSDGTIYLDNTIQIPFHNEWRTEVKLMCEECGYVENRDPRDFHGGWKCPSCEHLNDVTKAIKPTKKGTKPC